MGVVCTCDDCIVFFFSGRRRHTRCALVTGVQTCALPVSGDRIAAVGPIPEGATATTLIDATGRIVAPGFIDPHSHAAPNIQTKELAAALPMLHQGITTLAINPDGGGPAELGQQITHLNTNIPGVNVLPLIGHNAVRRAVMGDVARLATAEERKSTRLNS